MPRTARRTTTRRPAIATRHLSARSVIAAMATFAPAAPAAQAPVTQQSAAATSTPAIPAIPAIPDIPAIPAEATEIATCRACINRLRAQAQEMDDDVASLTHTACQIGEASDWRDARLPALGETITFWRNRYRAVLAQIRDERARLITLLSADRGATTQTA